ncbi:MAG: zinc-dependent metalloprotease family protein [Pantoea sp.]|uniref:zinc-dependent metalloprotease family protein n=1 Tax=Pantoea sp. TaxID=69393 RepID=UPI00238627FD|nr:zinc-dependent metalloprotease family protein [Pantoea sp.]MDE1187497.1 zinc-dependent metalloprotease family protein [Pantoea sp.]
MLKFKRKWLVTIIASTFSSTVIAAPQLFTVVDKDTTVQEATRLQHLRQQYQGVNFISVDKALLENEASVFLFNNNEKMTSVEIHGTSLEKDSNGIQIWQGHSDDEKNTASFAISDGKITGSIRLRDGSYYEVFPVDQARQILVKIDTSQLEADDNDVIADETTAAREQAIKQALSENENLNASSEHVRLRLLYVYTNQSRHWFSPDPALKAAQMNSELNNTYANSDTLVQFDVAGVLDTKMDESTMYSMLSQMQKTDTALGKLVAAKRAETRADLVVIISEAYQACGTAQKDKWATVVHTTCAVGVRALAHEIGHNFGLNHGEKELTWPRYAHGYRVPGYFSTIMSKRCGGCEAVNNFSDPLKSYKGVPIGTATGNDAVRFIKERRFIMAAMHPDWESQYVMNQGELPANQYFTVSLTEKQTDKNSILDHIITNPGKGNWPYDFSVAVNNFFPNDVVAAGQLTEGGKVVPKNWSSFENHIWLHQDQLATYKVDVERKTYAVVRNNKWSDVMAISGGDGLPADATMMLNIKDKTSDQVLETFYLINGHKVLDKTSWPHQLAQIINSQQSVNVIAGELKDGNVNTVTGSSFRNRLWFPLEKKNALSAELILLSEAENPWVEEVGAYGDKHETDLEKGTMVTMKVKNSSGVVIEQHSVRIDDAERDRYKWPAYVARIFNQKFTQIIIGEKNKDGSGNIDIIPGSQYRNRIWKKQRANMTVEVSYSK